MILVPQVRLNRHQSYRLVINGHPPRGIANGMGVPIVGNVNNRMGGLDIESVNPWFFAGPNQETLGVDRLVNLLGGGVVRGPEGITSPTRPAKLGGSIVHIPPAFVHREVPTPQYVTALTPPPPGLGRQRGRG